MTIWEILGIESTADTSVIKKAYAGQLKAHHPEEDPEGYQRIREAYDRAMKYAKQQHKSTPVMTADIDEASSTHTPSVLEEEPYWDDEDDHDDGGVGHDSIDRSEGNPVYGFMHQVRSLYEDYPRRIEPDAWSTLLQDDLLWNMKHQEAVSHLLLSYLEDYRHLPHPIWQILDEHFLWTERMKEDRSMADRYDEDWLSSVQERVQRPGLTYSVLADDFTSRDIDEIEEYFSCLETAFQALLANDLEIAGDALQEASSLYADDPERLHLQVQYEQCSGRYLDAVLSCSQGIGLQPDNMGWYRARAWNYYRNGSIEEATQDISYLLKHDPDEVSALTLLALCHREREELEAAETVLLRILEIDREDPTAHIQLIEVRRAILDQLQKDKASAAEVEARKIQIGHLPFGRQLNLFAKRIVLGGLGDLFRVILILVVHVWIHLSFLKHTGVPPHLFLTEVNQTVEWSDIPLRIIMYLFILIYLYIGMFRTAWKAFRFVWN